MQMSIFVIDESMILLKVHKSVNKIYRVVVRPRYNCGIRKSS